jgi:MFS family permease
VGSGLEDAVLALSLLLASRIFAGVCGANVNVAQAYIADITPAEKRSQRMGLIGMAFGLGFILGPALGGLGLKWFGHSGPGWLAAGLCAANFLLALAILPESWRPGQVRAEARPGFEQWKAVLGREKVGVLIMVFFLATFGFACFETTLGLLASRSFGLDPDRPHDAARIGYLYAFCGVIGAVIQGGAIGHLVRRFGETKIIGLSLVLFALGLMPLAGAGTWPVFLVLLGFVSVGTSLTRPPLFGLVSNLTPAHEQGVTLGVAQSAGSLARIVGPVFATTVFVRYPALLYWICGVISLFAACLVWKRFHTALGPPTGCGLRSTPQ